MRISKKISFLLLYILVLVLGVATLLPKLSGITGADGAVYDSGWFVALWAVLAFSAVICIWKCHLPYRVQALHFSLLLILAGAALTYCTAERGVVHLRENKPASMHGGMITLRFQDFTMRFYQGSDMPADYSTSFQIYNEKTHETEDAQVSMNQIYTYEGIRFYQTSYDKDLCGSYLSYNDDPYGLPVTYTGYWCLFLSFIWCLLSWSGMFRRLLRRFSARNVWIFCFFFLFMADVSAQNTLSEPQADQFGRLLVSYNGRICPIQTIAIDFTKKLHGKEVYKGFTAEQVFSGFLFYNEEWNAEPILHVKDKQLRQALHLSEYVSVNQLIQDSTYLLSSLVEAYYQGSKNKLHRAAANLDECLQLIWQLKEGHLLAVFPIAAQDGHVPWYTPVDTLPEGLPQAQEVFIRESFGLLYALGIKERNSQLITEVLDKIARYQQRYAGASLPGKIQVHAERIYNGFPFVRYLSRLNLSIGLFLFVIQFFRLFGTGKTLLAPKYRTISRYFLWGLSFSLLTFGILLRSLVCNRLPFGNGYETMLLLAWLVHVVVFFLINRFPLALSFGFLLSGFFLLVSGFSYMNPVMTPLVPVLSSPLLSVHVSLIMMAYALFAFTALCAVTALLLILLKRCRGKELSGQIESVTLLSRIFLYPALALLGAGIFVGAMWANVSWGRYWGWDPKEVWALINFLLYAVPLHEFKIFRRDGFYNAYMLLAFLSVLMTYIGVNYFLGGMHSYA